MRNGNFLVTFFLNISFFRSYPTYEEWKLHLNSQIKNQELQFLSYLWGMETSSKLANKAPRATVLILPMRNGNLVRWTFYTWIRGLFLSYLWGMETNFFNNSSISCSFFCSYPTYEEWKRNSIKTFFFGNKISSYPTYEEWKLELLIEKVDESNVLILPMRNGNIHKILINLCVFSVLILPMRNGNLVFLLLLLLFLLFVLILPMRNGNYQKYIFVSVFLYLRSYPTYEEWKPFNDWQTRKKIWKFLSYLWGMETLQIHHNNRRVLSSYPTYEEWKLSTSSPCLIFLFIVLILPMRNGNIRRNKLQTWRPEFLSYLWGMETQLYQVSFST